MVSEGQFVRLACPQGTAHYLRASCRPRVAPFIRVWKNNPASVPAFIPAASETEACISALARNVDLYFQKDEIDVHAWRPWSLLDNLKWTKLSRFHESTKFEGDGIVIQPFLHRSPQALDVVRAARTLAEWGFGVSTRALQDTLSYELLDHAAAASRRCSSEFPAVAIVVHLHYDELWPDFESRLLRLSVPFQLLLTTNGECPELSAKVYARFPDAKILAYPNRGRDVGPFIQLLRDGHLDPYGLICKVHGKRSAASGPRAVFGDIWRRSVLNDLLGSDAQVRTVLSRFVTEPDLGLIGPAHFRLPNEYRHSYGDTWSNNERLTKNLASRLGYPSELFKLDFFAGTMFWMRREVLDLLKPLDLSLDSFPEEKGQTDGTLQHALERLFGALPSIAVPTMKIAEASWRSGD
ncbi:MAG: rhamnan synthesis F [Afipia felis]|nr:rhamnan synthesis F [Afipia felis]